MLKIQQHRRLTHMRRTLVLGTAILSALTTRSVGAQTAAPESFVARDIALDIAIDYPNQRLSGSITYDLENWTPQPARQVSFLLNRLMEASSVRAASGASLAHTQDVVRFVDDPMRQVNQLRVTLPRPIASGGHTTLRIDYAGNLVGYTEIGWLYVKDHIDTAFTIIRNDALAFPMVGGIVDKANRKRPFSQFVYHVSVRVPAKYRVAIGGKATRLPHDDGTVTWHYESGKPARVMNVSIAPFDTLGENGVRVFYFPDDSLGARRVMASTQAALRTLTSWFGPAHDPLNVTITEIPNGWGSQAGLIEGIIQSAAAFRDPERMGELYHELSHIWNANATDLPSPRWEEGQAMFLEGLLREQLDRWTGRQKSETQTLTRVKNRINSDSSLQRVPLADYGKQRMTDWSYSVGELMFATLYNLVGQKEFNRILGGYYQRYANAGTTRNFVDLAKQTSSRDLTAFFDDWMFTSRWTDLLRNATSVADLEQHYR